MRLIGAIVVGLIFLGLIFGGDASANRDACKEYILRHAHSVEEMNKYESAVEDVDIFYIHYTKGIWSDQVTSCAAKDGRVLAVNKHYNKRGYLMIPGTGNIARYRTR